MKVGKKFVSLILGIIMLVSMLAGCGNSEDANVKTVTIWSSTGSAKAFWNDKVKQFNETIGKEKGIILKFEAQTDEGYAQKVDIAMQSGDLPDIFDFGNLTKAIELDVVAPLDDLPGMEPLIEKYKDSFVETKNTYKGSIYCLPSDVTTRGLIYNKKMFEEAGLVDENGEAKPPKTLTEFREYAKKLTDKSKNQYGVVFPLKWGAWIESDILGVAQTGTGYPLGYNPVEQKYDFSGLKPVISTYLNMKKDGSVFPGELSLDNDPARARFAEGGIGMKLSYSFDYGVFTSQFIPDFEWGVAPLPVVDENNVYKQNAVYTVGMKVSKKGIERHGKDVMGLVMSWWYSDENFIDGYKQGVIMPPDWEMVKDIELDDSMKQWKEFCSLQEISIAQPLNMPSNMDGKKTMKQVIVDDIWTNSASLDGIDKYTKERNEGIVKYKELNPDRDYSIYGVPEWNAKR